MMNVLKEASNIICLHTLQVNIAGIIEYALELVDRLHEPHNHFVI